MSDEENRSNFFISIHEEIFKLYLIIGCENELIHRNYLLEKIERILNKKPIVLHPLLEEHLEPLKELYKKKNLTTGNR